MSLLDKNKLFFGLIHYVLSEQKNVDWILKTSIADFLGVNLKLSEIDYSTNDLMKNMIDFLYDIKPYHVQFNKYIEKFLVNEDVNLSIPEICNETIKVRYDAITTEVDDIIGLYINDFKYNAWVMTQETIDWGTKSIYNKGDLIKYEDKVYKIEKKYIPTSEIFVFDYNYMSIVPLLLYTKDIKPTSEDKLYDKKDMNIVEMIGYTIKENPLSLNHKQIFINDVEYTLDITKMLFQDSDIVDMCNTHKSNRLCLLGLYVNNLYGVIHTDKEGYEKYLYVLDNDIKIDKPVYKFVQYEEKYDETQTVLTEKVIKYKMVQVGTIKSFSYQTDTTQFMNIVVDMIIDNKHTSVNYTNYYKENKVYYHYDNFNINEPNYDRIIDTMNAHFKGLTVDGGKFNIDNYGYDEYPYDKEKYDMPSVEVDYCMVVSTEYVYGYGDVQRTFVNVGDKVFSIVGLNKSRINVLLKKYGQPKKQLTTENYSLDNKFITIFDELDGYDELYINDGQHVLVYYAHPFVETDNDTIKRVRKELANVMILEPMDSDVALTDSKYFVHKVDKDGSHQLFASNGDFYVKDGKIEVHGLNENEHIIISSYDFRYIYDKIYSYEDKIGRSNNVITLDGEGMLRPLHEADRTDEMIASHPIDSVMYLENKIIDGRIPTADIKRIDNNNNIKYMTVDMPSVMQINGFTTNEDGLTSEIVLDDASLLMNNVPGRIFILHKQGDILVPAELIEYQNIREGRILTGIKRARECTPLYISRDGDKKYNELLSVGDYVYNADKTRWFELNTDTSDKSVLNEE